MTEQLKILFFNIERNSKDKSYHMESGLQDVGEFKVSFPTLISCLPSPQLFLN
jgi:hypothetical protein